MGIHCCWFFQLAWTIFSRLQLRSFIIKTELFLQPVLAVMYLVQYMPTIGYWLMDKVFSISAICIVSFYDILGLLCISIVHQWQYLFVTLISLYKRLVGWPKSSRSCCREGKHLFFGPTVRKKEGSVMPHVSVSPPASKTCIKCNFARGYLSNWKTPFLRIDKIQYMKFLTGLENFNGPLYRWMQLKFGAVVVVHIISKMRKS